jgi:hypothetical protein
MSLHELKTRVDQNIKAGKFERIPTNRKKVGEPTTGKLKKKPTGKKVTKGPSATPTLKDGVSVLCRVGDTKTIKLHKTPTEQGAPLALAKKLADRPFGIYDFENGVKLVFVLTQDAEKVFAIKLIFKRSKDE